MARPSALAVPLLMVVASCGEQQVGDDPIVKPDTLCAVNSVVDGDTVTCTSGLRIRLIGIDAPEPDQIPFGDQSRVALNTLLTDRTARIERDVEEHDAFGRTLAYLWLADTMVNETMVRDGWAVAFFIPPNLRYEDRLIAAQDAAQQDGAGHWSTGGFACLPVDYRQGNC